MSWIKAACSALLLTLYAACAISADPAAPEWLLGDWVLNSEKTHSLQPKQTDGGGDIGFGSPSISVGGVGIPLPGGSGTGSTPGGARDPRVLRCDAMTVTTADRDLHFTYRGSGEEQMKPGNDQGRKTSWNRKKLTQKYTTSSRSVSKTYQLDGDGALVVRVKINPKGSKSATHVRVFERPSV